jgi:hypothetical protein
MAENNAGGFGKTVEHPVFDSVFWPGTVGDSDDESIKYNHIFLRQALSRIPIAHISANCVDFFSLKSREDGHIGKIACMDNDIAPIEGCCALTPECLGAGG